MPQRERAFVPVEKLRDYALNPTHPEGRSKAVIFKEMLGIERRHANVLAELIKATLPRAPARSGSEDKYGQWWRTYHPIIGLNGREAVVTVAWIFKTQQPDVPVLISCYIEAQEQEKLRQLLRSE